MRKITFSIAINSNIYDLIPKVKQYMQDNGLSSFSNGSVSRGDAVQYCIKKFAETLGFEVNDNGLDLEFVSADQLEDKQTKDIMETKLCGILSSCDFSILEKYKIEGFRDRMDVFDYCDEIGIDWNKTIINKRIIYIKKKS